MPPPVCRRPNRRERRAGLSRKSCAGRCRSSGRLQSIVFGRSAVSVTKGWSLLGELFPAQAGRACARERQEREYEQNLAAVLRQADQGRRLDAERRRKQVEQQRQRDRRELERLALAESRAAERARSGAPRRSADQGGGKARCCPSSRRACSSCRGSTGPDPSLDRAKTPLSAARALVGPCACDRCLEEPSAATPEQLTRAIRGTGR